MNSIDLRKAAILVSVLDTASADALLEQMGPTADKVRGAVMQLDDVSEAEQAAVIQEFMGLGSGTIGKNSAGPTEVSWDLPDPATIPVREPTSSAVHENIPFAFLLETESLPLSEQLQRENPQLAAVVLAHLPAEQAAEVLQHLPTSLASDVLVRIAQLDEMSPEVLADIEQQLRSALAPYLRSKKSRQHGAARMGAILKSMPNASRSQLEVAIVQRDRHLLKGNSGAEQPVAPPQKLRIAPATLDAETPSPARKSKPTSKVSATHALRVYPLSVPAPPFSELSNLNDADWQRLLEHADADLILLAFAGAEPKLINRLLRGFTKQEAEYWRKQFANPGPVRVSEIDAAQERLTQLAAELTDQGILHWKSRRGLAALA